MPINPNDVRYRRARRQSELPIVIPEKPLIFRRGSLPDYIAEIEALYGNYIKNSAETGRNKDAIGRAVENKDKFLSHFFFTLGTTGYGLLGYKSEPDPDEKGSILNELLKEEYGISMKPYVGDYVNRMKEKDGAERKFQEAQNVRIEIIKEAIKIGELKNIKIGISDISKVVIPEIDNVATDLLALKSGITNYERITGKKPEIMEFREVLKKEVKKKLGASLNYFVNDYVDKFSIQSIRDSYNCWLSQRSESNAQNPSQSVEFA